MVSGPSADLAGHDSLIAEFRAKAAFRAARIVGPDRRRHTGCAEVRIRPGISGLPSSARAVPGPHGDGPDRGPARAGSRFVLSEVPVNAGVQSALRKASAGIEDGLRVETTAIRSRFRQPNAPP